MQIYLIALCIISVTLVLIKSLQNFNYLGEEVGRKILHLVAVLICGYVVYIDNNPIILSIIFIVSTLGLAYIAHKNVLRPNVRKSFGIALFPLAFVVMIWSPLSKESILFGTLILAISDAMAGVIVTHWAKQKITFLYESKSWLVFFVFFLSSVVIGYFFIGFNTTLIILALVPALTELFSYKGSDNFSIPIVASIWLEILKNKPCTYVELAVFIIVLGSLILLHSKKWLTIQGITAALLLATIIIFGVGSIYLLPIGLFFVVGSVSSKLTAKHKEHNGRSAVQVFANGGVGVLSLILFALTDQSIFILGYLISISISLADTMSSDLGTYFGQRTYDIITAKPIEIGLSGGVSGVGTLAGILASIIFGFGMFYLFGLDWNWVICIVIAGVLGMFLDSVLGSAFQAKYKSEDKMVEDKNSYATLVKGYEWMTNNTVNFTANILTTTFFIIIFYFLQF